VKTIWKFEVDIVDEQTIAVPRGAQPLSVRMQGATPQLWALVDPDAEFVPLKLGIYGTGGPVPDQPGTYLDTFYQLGGALVWHAFIQP